MTVLTTLLNYLTRHPHPLRSPETSLTLSAYAPAFLSSSAATKDTQETWLVYEQLLLSCLRTQDDTSARLCLQRLSDRFGVDSPRVKALNGLYDEATAQSRKELEEVLKRYDDILKEDPTNMPIEKRRISLLLSLSRTVEAITALTSLLDHSPNDAESWAHLSSLYFTQGLYSQSIFCLEEVLLILPNAYNIFARIGEVTYIASDGKGDGLVEAIKYFSRAVELCEGYLRGWYGLKLATGKALETGARGLDKFKAEKLNQMATKELVGIVSHVRRKEKGWEGYDAAEVEAAKALVDANVEETVR